MGPPWGSLTKDIGLNSWIIYLTFGLDIIGSKLCELD
jgi:hypothetical protein